MFDIAWTEMLVIAVVTIVVVGPKDLPKVMKAVGGFIAKARSLAGKFQSDMDALARETELDELRKQARAYQATLLDPKRELQKMIDPSTGEEVKPAPKISELTVGGNGGPRPYSGSTKVVPETTDPALGPATPAPEGSDAPKDANAIPLGAQSAPQAVLAGKPDGDTDDEGPEKKNEGHRG
ncbi:Sec-independent protein translocase protein TatB [Iodidimonas gelatinilytica]|uniref:Sec-independent protein translocase protein TatB n=1 Tax=Iodidimonas gelatinilytica TaxID=1236966 RepID=A0A5A7MS52_9PROT|nr:Sec-independent protein translocase protein TatB [Iodidimonas gelatinilytica]GEQ98787.1 Sec-independent protein translocase protein TatB [Iodidimonas gelatinilytica]GER01323.1 Sec-independent protein translocase protein TatB [Iodidimonas gelatinilytica]